MANTQVLKLRVLRTLRPLLDELGISEQKAAGKLNGLLNPRKAEPKEDQTRRAHNHLFDSLGSFRSFARLRVNYQDPEIRKMIHDLGDLVIRVLESHSVEIYSHFSTPVEALDYLFEREEFTGKIWEPCCGEGRISKYLEAKGFEVISSDLRLLGDIYGARGKHICYLTREHKVENVITNLPDAQAVRLAAALHYAVPSGKIALLLRINLAGALERAGVKPDRIHVLPNRPSFHVGGNEWIRQNTRWDYGWFIWDPRKPLES